MRGYLELFLSITASAKVGRFLKNNIHFEHLYFLDMGSQSSKSENFENSPEDKNLPDTIKEGHPLNQVYSFTRKCEYRICLFCHLIEP